MVPMRYRTSCVCAVLAVTFSSGSLRAADGEKASLEEKFLREYPAASKKLQDFYSHLVMSAKATIQDIEIVQGKIVETKKFVQEWEYAANGEMLRWVGTDLSGSPHDGTTFVFVATPHLTFRLHKPPSSINFSIVSLGKRFGEVGYNGTVTSIRSRAIAPFTIFDTLISDFLGEKSLRINRVHRAKERDVQGVKVEWMNTNPNRVGWFLFSEDDWALREYEFHFTDVNEATKKVSDVGHYGLLEYAKTKQGGPILKKVQTWRSIPAGKYLASTVEVMDVKLEEAPLGSFTLEAFGILTPQQ
jgi:hypothetical protein